MRVSVILVIALGVAALLRHRSAALRHWILAAAIGCAAVMPLMHTVVPSWPLPLGGPAEFQPIGLATDATVRPNPDPTIGGSPVGGSVRTVVASAFRRTVDAFSGGRQGGDSFFTLENLNQLFRPVWIAGFAISALILLVGLARLGSIAWRSQRLTAGRWVDLAGEISCAYRLGRPVVLLQSTHPTLLVTWGLARPKVLLPAAATEWSDARARVILSHELAHISRGDWIVYLAAELLRAVYWFNPLVWIMCRRLRLESEHACDDEVMSRGIEGADYATHLVDLARALNQRRYTWLPAPAMARPSSLERRVRAMLNDRLNRSSLTGSTRVVTAAVLLAVTAAVAAAQNVYTTFSGTVADQQGARIPGVTLVLSNAPRQAKYEVKTNQAGSFEFVGLPPGDYQLEVAGLGFRKITESLKIVAPGVQRSVVLQIGSLEESITVRFNPADPIGATPAPRSAKAEKPAPDHSGCVASPEGGRIVAPRKIKDVAPVYPASLRSAATEGTVVMQGRIGLDGFITDIHVLGEAHPELANAAMEAVRQWEYSATLLNCTPVDPAITVTTRFIRMP